MWSAEPNSPAIGSFVRVLDVNGKVIARLYQHQPFGTTVVTMFGNSTQIFFQQRTDMFMTTREPKPFSIEVINGFVYIKYGNFSTVVTTAQDATADITKPKYLEMYFFADQGVGPLQNKILSIQNPRFYNY